MCYDVTMKTISLTRGKTTKIDDDDFELVSKYTWHCTEHGYASTRRKDNRKFLYLHRFIMKARKGEEVDHRNGDRLDNRKSNLRICDRTSNSRNTSAHRDNKTGYKGVYFDKRTMRFCARIMVSGKTFFLGRHDSAKKAHEAYKKAAVLYHKNFAKF